MIENWEQYKDLEYYPDRVCACRCGGRIKVKLYHKYYGIPKYLPGHQSRYRKHTKEAKQKMSKAKEGYKVTEETRQKLRESNSGENNGFYGKHHTEEAKQKNREAHIGKPSGFKGKHHTEEAKQRNREKHSKENHPNWKGGISSLPYPFEFNEGLKESIRERDNYICQLCGKTEKENGRRLTVHHIDYNKEHCDPKNLVSLCIGCNNKVNYGREYWNSFFLLKNSNRKESA